MPAGGPAVWLVLKLGLGKQQQLYFCSLPCRRPEQLPLRIPGIRRISGHGITARPAWLSAVSLLWQLMHRRCLKLHSATILVRSTEILLDGEKSLSCTINVPEYRFCLFKATVFRSNSFSRHCTSRSAVLRRHYSLLSATSQDCTHTLRKLSCQVRCK